MTIRLIATACALVALAGCASNPADCDATDRDASMLRKMNCDYSGGYSAQVKQKEQALNQARQENAMFKQVYDNIAAQQASTRKDLASQQQQQAQLNTSLGQLLGQLKAKHADKGTVQQQVAGLEKQLAAAKAVPASTNPAQLAAKQQELQALQKKVNQLQFSLGYE